MADAKVTALVAITSAADTDVIYIIDDPGGTPLSRKITKANFLKVGTDIQAYAAELAAIAGLTSAADKLPYFTGSGTADLADLTAAGRALLDDADAAAQRATLDVDQAGTDNSIDVTLAGTPDYLTIVGQVITRNQIDLTADVTGDLPVSEGGTGASDAATARTNLGVQPLDAELTAIAGLTSAAGKLIEFTGSGTAQVIDHTAVKTTESIIIACSDETTDLTTGTAKVKFRMPYAFTVTEVRASVSTAPTGSAIIVDINESGTTILSTKITIDASETSSETAATAPVVSDSSLADDAEMSIDIDQIGSSTAGKGLKVMIIGNRT